jgi:hypothetical protein
MKLCRAILFLLLATCLVAGPVLPPAANAVQATGQSTGSSPGTSTVANGGAHDDDSGRGDPGGAGDGLGADLENPVVGTAQSGGMNAVLELMLQLMRLMQAAG